MQIGVKQNRFRPSLYGAGMIIAFIIVFGLIFVLEVYAAPSNQNNPPLLIQIHRPEWEGKLIDVEFSPDAKLLAIAGVEQDLLLYDATTMTEVKRLTGHTDETIDVDWGQTGYIATGSKDKTVRVWNDQFQPVLALPQHDSWVVEVAWSRDGTKLATLDEVGLHAYATGTWATQGTLRVWDMTNNGTLLATVDDLRDASRAIAWSADGTKIAAASKDPSNAVRIWDVQTGELEQRFTYTFGWATRITAFAWSLDDKSLAVGDLDGYIQIWDIETGATVTENKCLGPVSELVWRADGRLASVCYSALIAVEHPYTEGVFQILGEEGGSDEFVSVAWSQDGNRLVAGSKAGAVKIWDTSNLPSLEGLPTAIPPKDWNP